MTAIFRRVLFTLVLPAMLLLGGCLGGTTTQTPADDDHARAAELAAEAERFAAQAEENEVAWAGQSPGDRTAPPPIPPTVRRTELPAPPRPAPPRDTDDPDPDAGESQPDPEPRVVTVTREMSETEMTATLAERLLRDARSTDASLKPWLARAALAAVDPAYELSAADLSPLSAENRRLVTAYQRLFAQIGRSTGASAASDRQVLSDLAEELADAIDQHKPLTIRNLKLCKKVNGFGVYETFSKNVFLAGQSHPMIVYAELDHFRSDVGPDGKHLVRLTQEVVLYNDADGLPVWRQRPVAITDESYNRREDFFVVQVIRLSDRLTVGKYQLKVTITDEVGRSVDEATVPIQIVADPELAKP